MRQKERDQEEFFSMKANIELVFILLIALIFMIIFTACEDPPPIDMERYIIDVVPDTECAQPPMMRSNIGENNDISVLGADKYYCHSPQVEIRIRKEIARMRRIIEECQQ